MRYPYLVVAAAAVAACSTEDLPTFPGSTPGPRPAFIVSDGMTGGNDHFFFLPPLVPAPTYSGTFDGTQQPEVKICAWSGGCGAEVAAFTMTTGPGSETIRVVPEDEHYIVNWHTDLSNLTLGATYRIRVLVGNQVLGFADVVPTGTGKAKNAVTGDEIALKDGSTLPIKFRIEDGAIITTVPDPVPTVGTGTWEHIAIGSGFTCALTNTGAPYCWGVNSFGVLGLGYYSSDKFDQPQAVTGGHTFVSLHAGAFHACGIKADGTAWCWGNNADGMLGRGTKTYSEPTPGLVAGGLAFASLAMGLGNTCGLTTGGEVYCWGRGLNGMIGNGSTAEKTVPAKITSAANGTFTRLAISTSHGCALTSAGVPWCWGNNDKGQLGRGFTSPATSIPAAATLTATFTALATAHRSTCGIAPGGQVRCWGQNEDGELGLGYSSFSAGLTDAPILSNLSYARIYAGERQYCGLTSGGQAVCWGWNEWAQLGIGLLSTEQPTPTPVTGGGLYGSLAMGLVHSCGINGNGLARCWGQNLSLQLGNPDPTTAVQPVDVITGLEFMTW